ncbi:hypothetical protein PG990_008437 [Apiospora arundinis]
MAPLWGSSWSSTVHSMYRYNPLKQQTTDTNGAAASPSSATSDPSLRPSIGQILMSKRVRYTVTAVFTILLFSLAIRNYDHFPSIDSLRNKAGVETSAAATNSTPECPTAQALLKIDGSKVDWTSRADRVMMYPESMMPNPASTDGTSDDQRLLIKARDAYRVKLVPVNVQRRNGADATWAESFTKLLAFNQTHTWTSCSSPRPCPVAMPRAYWLFPKDKTLSSQLMLVQPSATEFDRVMQKTEVAGVDDYDMEIVNQLYADQAMILPHRPYDLLTGEFRGDEHEKYLGTDREPWDPVKIYNEAKFLHFSDWPVPKPWITMSQDIREKNQPKCVDKNGQQDCSSRELWNGFYTDFTNRRRSVCDIRTRTRR